MCVKTTVNISDNIAARAKQLAKENCLTLRALVEEWLRLVLEKHAKRQRARLKPVTFKGNGLTPAFRSAGWSKLRDAVYEGRGTGVLQHSARARRPRQN